MIADGLFTPNQLITTEWSPKIAALIFKLWGLPTVDMFAIVHNTHVSDSGAPRTGRESAITTFAGTVNAHIFSYSLTEQGLSETLSHSERRGHPDRPLVAVSTVVSASDPTVCGSTSVLLISSGPVVSARLHLGLLLPHCNCSLR